LSRTPLQRGAPKYTTLNPRVKIKACGADTCTAHTPLALPATSSHSLCSGTMWRTVPIHLTKAGRFAHPAPQQRIR
jgi:hypothetical protein